MVTIKRIAPGSAFRVGLWVGIVGASLQVTLFVMFLLLVVGVPAGQFGLPFLVRVSTSVFFTGISVGMMAGLLAIIYNFVARRFGGLKVELSQIEWPEKRKNDHRSDHKSDHDDEL